MTDSPVDLEDLSLRAGVGEGCGCAAAVPTEALRALIAEVSAAREATRGWIACSERMPDPNQQVLFVALGRVCVGPYRPDRRHDVWDDLLIVDMCGDCDHYTAEQVTHWMPQPSAPLEGSP